MTNEEAIKTIRVAIAEVEWDYPLDYAIAFETAIEALEKQIAKKPTTLDRKNENGMIDLTFKCPACNAFFFGTTANYCRLCGQKFSWSDEK